MTQTQPKPLISVLVVCYNNQQYITQTLQSIFDQTYPNIEIMIGDDASRDFDASALIEWINLKRTPNISRITICENEENKGTVANLEILQKKSHGEFLFHIAADDTLHNPTVLEKAYELAEQVGPSAEMIIGQTELWDITLTQKLGDWTTPELEEFIKKASAQELFTESSCRAILPASYLYRRSMLQKVGKLSDCYRLVEDWPTHLRVTRQGVKPLFLDGVPLIKHRDGGISHGNTLHSQKTFLTYYADCLNGYWHEVMPYRDILVESERARSNNLFMDRIRAYYAIHVPKYYKALEEAEAIEAAEPDPQGFELIAKNAATAAAEEAAKSRRAKLKDILFRVSRKKVVLCSILLAILFAGAVLLTSQLNGFIRNVLCLIFADFSLLFLLAAAVLVGINLLFRFRHTMRECAGTGKATARLAKAKDVLFRVSRKKSIVCTFFLLILAAVLTVLASQMSGLLWIVLYALFGVLSLISLFAFAVEVAANIFFKLRQAMRDRENHGAF